MQKIKRAVFELKNKFRSTNHSEKGCLIFKVLKIVSVAPEIKSIFESEVETLYSSLYYAFDESILIFKGDLIDFYLNEIVEKYYKKIHSF